MMRLLGRVDDRKARSLVLGVLFGVAAVLGFYAMSGCELVDPKINSPFTGEPATASQITQQAVNAERDARDKAAAEAKAAADELRAAQADAVRKAASIRAGAEKSGVQARADLAILEADTTLALGRADSRLSDATADLDRTLAAIRDKADTGMAQIQARTNAMQKVAGFVLDNPIVKTAATGVGIDTGGATNLLGVLGAAGAVGWFNRRSKQLADAAYEEAEKKERERAAVEKAARDKARADAQLQLLTMMSDPKALAAAIAGVKP